MLLVVVVVVVVTAIPRCEDDCLLFNPCYDEFSGGKKGLILGKH